MSKSKHRIPVPTMGFNKEEVAAYIGLGTTKFDEIKDELYASGFPQSNAFTKRWYRPAVDRWLALTSGMEYQSQQDQGSYNPWENVFSA